MTSKSNQLPFNETVAVALKFLAEKTPEEMKRLEEVMMNPPYNTGGNPVLRGQKKLPVCQLEMMILQSDLSRDVQNGTNGKEANTTAEQNAPAALGIEEVDNKDKPGKK